MKKILFTLLFIPSIAYAGDEEFDCAKSHKENFAVECKAKKDGVSIASIEINGGWCESHLENHKIMNKDQKIVISDNKVCGYVAKVTIHTQSGKTQHFYAM